MPDADAIRWFKEQFQGMIGAAIQNTPFSLDMITAIACQETGDVWSILYKKQLAVNRLLELCVGDTLDGSGGRKAFPTSRGALESVSRGREMFEIARQALVDMAQYVPGYKSVAAKPDKFCHAFGIFQYDLQYFHDDPDYFLLKGYANFNTCLTKCLGELNEAMKGIGLEGQTPLTDYEMACIGIAYNIGPGNFSEKKGLEQGYFDGKDHYGEALFRYLNLSKKVTTP
jgi:hypothetical protein